MPALEMTLSEFASWVQARGEALAHASLREPLTAARVAITSSIRDNFDQGHDPDGRAWLPLKNPSPKRGGASAKPLRDKGILMAAGSGGANSTTEIGDTELVFRIGVDYGAVHQQGASIFFPERRRQKPWVFRSGGKTVFTRRIRSHRVVIPARPFAGFGPPLLLTLDRIFGEWLERRAL